MNLDWFRTFAEVVERRSYSRAADALFITQPAVSQHIRNLERVFGVELRVRGVREFRTTDAGDRVYELSRRITNDVFQMREHLRPARTMSRQIVVGGGPTALIHYFPAVFREFWRQLPDVEIKTVMRADLLRNTEALLSGEVDLIVQIMRHIPKWLCRTPCFEDEFIAVVNPEHRLACATSVDPATLAQERIAVPPSPSESRQMFDAWFAAHGILDIHTIECDVFDQGRAIALAGAGVALITRVAVWDDLAANRLHEMKVEGFDLRRTIYLVWRPDPIPEVATMVRIVENLYGDNSAFS